MYIICATPLCKAYLPEWHDRLMENPELLNDDKTPFDFTAVTGTGGLRIKFNTPQHITSLGRKLTDEKEMQCLFDWLVGDQQSDRPSETDVYGIVAFDPKIDLVSTTDRMSLLELQVSDNPKEAAKAKAELAKLQLDTAQRIKATRAAVREAADRRVKRAMRTIHNNLIRQWQINEESKLGKYPPSITEMLGAKVLNTEIEAATAKGAKLKEKMNKLMNRQAI